MKQMLITAMMRCMRSSNRLLHWGFLVLLVFSTAPVFGQNVYYRTATPSPGNFNAGIGWQTLNLVTSGTHNVSNGYQTMFATTTGSQNSANGSQALRFNTSGSMNTGIGYHALFSNTTGNQNTAVGHNALASSTTAPNNTALGFEALRFNTGGTSNVAAGYQALRGNTTGNFNTATGFQVLFANTTGRNNTASGSRALQSNTTGSGNTAAGVQSMFSNTTGSNNTGFGINTLVLNTTGTQNTAMGYSALTGNATGTANSALGYQANVSANNLTNATAIGAFSIVPGSNAVQLGNNAVTKVYAGVGNTATLVTGNLQVTGGSPVAGQVLTAVNATGLAAWQTPASGGSGWSLTGNAGTVDGTNFIGTTDAVPFNIRVNNQKAGRLEDNLFTANTFYGVAAGNANALGTWNTAIGYTALAQNTDGSYNTAVGFRALTAATIAQNNTGLGFEALINNVTGNANTAVGVDAMYNNATGTFNTSIGVNSLFSNNSGLFNNGLGALTDVSSPNFTNATAIGCFAIVNQSDKVRIGDANVTMIEGNVMFTPSDQRFKSNVNAEDVKGLDFIQRLRPVVYNFETRRFQEFLTQHLPDSLRSRYLDRDFSGSTAIRQSGFLAQEVEQAAKESGYDFNGLHVAANEKDNYSIAYSQFVVPLVKGMQEQQVMIEEQQAEIAALKATMAELVVSLKGSGSSGQGGSLGNVEVFPNPSGGLVTVQLNGVLADRLTVTSLGGVVVYQGALGGDVKAHAVDLTGVAAGIYLVSLTREGREVASKRIVLE